VLILVENLSVPRDRRVWQESLALSRAGFDVVVVCPRGDSRDPEPFARVEGIDIHRFRPLPATGTALSYFREYAWALWQIRRLMRRLARRRSFDFVHACNPPDVLLLAALPLRRAGARFVFDHHDLVPELYLARFARGKDLLYRVARGLERLNFRLADVVISPNESYREVALSRGRKHAEDVFVVRNAPDLRRFQPVAPEVALKRGRPHLLAYVGVMGPQDGIDYALRALAVLRGRRLDWHAVFVGDGDVLPAMRELARELGLEDVVEFTGWRGDDEILRILSTADVCLAPEPSNPLNDVSTMIKVAEYMAMARPIASFDLIESRRTAGEAALYAPPNDVRRFAECMQALLDSPDERARRGQVGRERIERTLSWEHSERALLAAYERAAAL
jgi:glycosyltransferase involved in cell wall biosynthesis